MEFSFKYDTKRISCTHFDCHALKSGGWGAGGWVECVAELRDCPSKEKHTILV